MRFEDAYALVIGVTRYASARPLPPSSDASDLAAALTDPAHGAYDPARVQLLAEEAATGAAIRDGLAALARATGPTSTALVYFSGHGAAATADDGAPAYFLLPVDAVTEPRSALPRTAISHRELAASLRAIPAARLAVVLDCCRAAGLVDDLAPELVAPLARGRGRALLAAAREDGGAAAAAAGRASPFTAALLRGLRGAVPSTDGVIRVSDLFHYVQQEVAFVQPGQRPVFRAELEEDFAIARARGGAPAAIAVPPAPDGLPYDALISYCHDDRADRSWVTELLAPYLEGLGLRLCLPYRDFRLGQPRLRELERAVASSRYTVAVFTPAYVAGAAEETQWLVAAHAAQEAPAPNLIPLLRKPCEVTLFTRMTELLDVTSDADVPAALPRLALQLRRAPSG
jgi:hypothetical protein